jgi:large subunit ribosomal protein L30
MGKIKITQVKSSIKRPQNQKRTLEALGLKKIGQVVEHNSTPNILGMVKVVEHLINVQQS